MLTSNILQFLTDLALNPVDFSVNLVYEFLQGDSDPDVNIVYSTLLTLFHVQYKIKGDYFNVEFNMIFENI